MKKLFYIISLLFSVVAGLVFVATMASSTSAPQEAAGAAMASALTIIPYTLARAIEKLSD